jgi:predicted peptidase
MIRIFPFIMITLLAKGATAQQMEQIFKVCNEIPYLISLPDSYSSNGEATSLLLYLHGSGERGDDLNKVKAWGPPKLISEGMKFPFIVVSPQCPVGQGWDVYVLKQLLDHLLKTYNVDKNRIYLTGLSMGGFGTWAMATAFPEYFAAIAPICGGGDSQSAYRIKDIPCQVFHGKLDKAVPEQRSAEMVDALKKLGADVKYTVLPEGGHAASWIYAYNKADLWNWFLSQKKE